MSALSLPINAVRTGLKLAGRFKLPVIAGAAAVIYRKARQSAPAPVARVMPEPRQAPAKVPVAEPQVVVDTTPLAEAAVDLDVEVTLPSELPIRSYDALAAKDATSAIRELTDVEEIRTVLAFEEENAKRSTVLTAARAHLAGLAVQS